MKRITNNYSKSLSAYVDFSTAYILELLGYNNDVCNTLYYATPDTINEDPVLDYTHNILNTYAHQISDLVLTPAPSLLEAADFLRREYNVYITVFPKVKPVQPKPEVVNDNEIIPVAYTATGTFGFIINRFVDNDLLEMTSNDELANKEEEKPVFTSYYSALDAAIIEICNHLYEQEEYINEDYEGSDESNIDTEK